MKFLTLGVSNMITLVKLTPNRPVHHNQKRKIVSGGLILAIGVIYKMAAIT